MTACPARPSVGRPARPRSPTKRAARLGSRDVILDAATTLFLRNGYLGTSMDDIAARAGVSKQTVYTHFADKEQLFTDLVLGNIERVEAFVQTMTRLLEDTTDLEGDLRELARRYVSVVIQPQVVQLRRLVIGEAGRFPDLARTYYERVPARTTATLAAQLQRLADRGLLRLEDPHLAAGQLAWLILAVPLDVALLCGDSASLPAAERERLADAAVRVFLAAYGRG